MIYKTLDKLIDKLCESYLLFYIPLIFDLINLLCPYPHKVHYLDDITIIYNTRFDYLLVMNEHLIIILICTVCYKLYLKYVYGENENDVN